MRILSVNIGGRRPVTIKQRAVETGIYKIPATGPVPVSRYGLQDDVRVEPRKMGLEHHAVYAYPHEHYAFWQHALGHEPYPMGQFGENLTVTGLLEDEVRIGDIFRFGGTVLQVAQPRIPCAKLNERMGLRFAPMFLASYKVGYYLRVLREGSVAAGDPIELIDRDEASPTMEEFVRVSQFETWDALALQHLLQARDLMPAWREIIEDRLARARVASGWHGLRELEVVRVEPECEDTVSLSLKCRRGRPLAPFRGGQQLMVVLGGRSAQQLRRAYALSGSPQDLSTYRITVRRMTAPDRALPDGAVSSHLVGMNVGEHVLCAAPFGASIQAIDSAGRERIPVLLSEGLGIAPMLSLLYEFEAGKVRTAYLFHQAVAPEPQGLLSEVAALAARNKGFQVIRVAKEAPGPIDAEMIRRHVPLAQVAVQIAGSRGFVERLASELKTVGLDSSVLAVMSFD